jgi:hypothetical protein
MNVARAIVCGGLAGIESIAINSTITITIDPNTHKASASL